MSQIVLHGDFTGGTGAVAWDVAGINNGYHAHHVENGSFNSPITLPPGLYNVVLQGSCAGSLRFNIQGNINFCSPPVPDDIDGSGSVFNRGYTIHVI
ncbi:hypothetical protein KXQ82_06660 [Mucilaginibacter sp. HMF5004]|uniref:hypothetical protein n=1 Tax=Mucilaginibacter rivuli TaxID=2857527 RepID=UPI001C5DDDEB|nr:hypothetical protein [Mucilaginibacter rivuli]MBW4889387.1 hypothetical protein [Mucilaginibacter rivuli]